MKMIFASAIALSLLTGTAMAAPSHTGQTNSQQGQKHQSQVQQHTRQQQQQQAQNAQGRANRDKAGRRDNNGNHYANGHQQREYEYNGRRYRAVQAPAWRAPRGHNESRKWTRGDRLPAAYRDRAYVMDYRTYHLQRPAYGYQWVRVSNNVYLVNKHNGLVAQIVWSMFY